MQLLFLLLLGLLTLPSCTKDSDCNNQSLSTILVGSWSISKNNISLGTIEFLDDGTFIDNGSIFGFGILDGELLTNKTYVISGSETMTITFSKNGSASILNKNYHAIAYSCTEIMLDNGSVLYTLTR